MAAIGHLDRGDGPSHLNSLDDGVLFFVGAKRLPDIINIIVGSIVLSFLPLLI